jgi:hypothetical protein
VWGNQNNIETLNVCCNMNKTAQSGWLACAPCRPGLKSKLGSPCSILILHMQKTSSPFVEPPCDINTNNIINNHLFLFKTRDKLSLVMEEHSAVNRPPTTIDDQDILDNIDGRMHGPMKGFIQRYFTSFEYSCEDFFLEIHAAGAVSRRYAIPSAPSPDKFLQWFSHHGLDTSQYSWHASSDAVTPGHENPGDSARLLMTMAKPLAANAHVQWDQVQVVGQFYHLDSVCYRDGLIRLCRSAY